MNKGTLLTFLGAILVVGLGILLIRGFSQEDNWICQEGVWVKHGNPTGPKPTGACTEGQQFSNGQKEETGIANPASKNCLDKGGKLEIVKETAGDLGVCRFDDGSVCEEWKFFREECKKGQNTLLDNSHSYYGRISLRAADYVFTTAGVDYQLKLPEGYSKDLKDRLTIEAKSGDLVTLVAAEEPLLSKILFLQKFLEK